MSGSTADAIATSTMRRSASQLRRNAWASGSARARRADRAAWWQWRRQVPVRVRERVRSAAGVPRRRAGAPCRHLGVGSTVGGRPRASMRPGDHGRAKTPKYRFLHTQAHWGAAGRGRSRRFPVRDGLQSRHVCARLFRAAAPASVRPPGRRGEVRLGKLLSWIEMASPSGGSRGRFTRRKEWPARAGKRRKRGSTRRRIGFQAGRRAGWRPSRSFFDGRDLAGGGGGGPPS